MGADLFSKHLLTTWYVRGTVLVLEAPQGSAMCPQGSALCPQGAHGPVPPWTRGLQSHHSRKRGKKEASHRTYVSPTPTWLSHGPNLTSQKAGKHQVVSGWNIWWVTASGRCLYYIPTLLARLSVLPKATPLISKGARILSYCLLLNPHLSHCTVLHWFRSWKSFYCKKFGEIV